MSSCISGIAPRPRRLSMAPRPVVVASVVARLVASVVASVVVVFGGACSDHGVRAPVTIVVDTDGARAREDAERLLAVQRGVQDDRAQIELARADLAAARKSLETAASPEQKRALQQQVRDLESRLQAPAVAVDVVTRDELDTQLRAQEERLKSFISAELAGRSTPAATTIEPPPQSPATKTARALLADGRKHLQQLGLDAVDVVGAAALAAEAEGALDRRDDAAAAVAARAFVDKANAAVVDIALVRRKYDRVSATLTGKRFVSETQQRVQALLQDAATKTRAGDAAGANAALNDVLAIAR